MLERPIKPPIFNVPMPVVALSGLMLLIYLVQDNLGPLQSLDVLRQFAFVPARVTQYFQPELLSNILDDSALRPDGEAQATMARFFLEQNQLKPWTWLTYAFLHGSWSHVLLNSLWFLSFGAAVARRFDAARFLLFFALTAIAGVLMHYFVHPLSAQPVVGASAAVSGCMGAAVRFIFAPGAPMGEQTALRFLNENAAYHLPAPPLGEVLANSKAMSFLGIWFLINLVVGVASTQFGYGDAPIAWEAHIGGLLAGFLLFPLFDQRNHIRGAV